MKMSTMTHKQSVASICLVVLAVCLLLPNLGGPYLWQDEAETALVARTIWTHGIPQVTDGHNYFYQTPDNTGAVENVWAWTPWLQFYVAALSLKLFGENQFAARIPFVCIGLLSLLIFFRCLAGVFDFRTAYLSTLLLILCVPFLLYLRQCRYYALVIFATIWAMNALTGIIRSQKGSGFSLVIALFIMFHSNYMNWLAFCGALFFFLFLKSDKPHFKKIILLILAISALIQLPWFFFFKTLEPPSTFWLAGFLKNTALLGVLYFYEINSYVTPLLVFLIPLILLILKKGNFREEQAVSRLNFLYFNVILIFITIGVSTLGPSFNLRYLCPVIPNMILLMAVILMTVIKRSLLVGLVLTALTVCTNALNLPLDLLFNRIPAYRTHGLNARDTLKPPLLNYIRELVRPIEDPMSAIVQFLKTNAVKEDVVAMTYGKYPIMFHTGLRVIGGLSAEGLHRSEKAKWIIPRKHILSVYDGMVMLHFIDHLAWHRYEKIPLAVNDYPWGFIPEPRLRQSTRRLFDKQQAVTIYRRLLASESSTDTTAPSLFYDLPSKRIYEDVRVLRDQVGKYLA